MKLRTFHLPLVAALLVALPAAAQYSYPPGTSPWYFGAGVGQGHFGVSGTDLTGLENAQVDDKQTTYTIRTGWRFNPYWAFEIGYYDLGKYGFHGRTAGGVLDIDGEARAKSVGLSVVGFLPMRNFDLYGRLGYARSELKVNASANLVATPVNEKQKQNEATYGIGTRWNVTRSWGIFAEWMKNDKIEVDSYLIGVDVRF
jgi:OOP family OmpA-OmpF porin